jgi:predicted ArsR family transcriptional regulator
MDIATIRRDADEMIRLATIEVGYQGGRDAVHDFLKSHLCTVIAAASTAMGEGYAHQLLSHGLRTVEARQEMGG